MASGLDVENEHALVRLATSLLVGNLADMGGGPTAFASVAVGFFPPVDRGPIHAFQPRHWYWALFFEPRVGVVLREGMP
ncbi:MAG: hypothetical protein EXR66_05995 [Dehalococcoidia bacterium]|nr:hypothetical protein [Dehalococcoidia bacterium]